MAKVAESVTIAASLAETWELYFEPRGWPAWVDGFAAVEASDGYPGVGGTLRWRSTPAGRGRVSEKVLEHEPRRLHRIAFDDPESEGELVTTFAIEPGGAGADAVTRVTQELDYRLRRRGPFALVTDRLFVRSQMARSLERSLSRLRAEVEASAQRE